MKRKMLVSALVVALAAALIGGGTMAWFTAKAKAPDAVFTAGTVMITADQSVAITGTYANVNPGDCFDGTFDIKNTGSKAVKLRVKYDGTWGYDWDWLWDNRAALCFTLGYPEFADKQALINYFTAEDTKPASPVTITPCEGSGWSYDADDGYFYFNTDVAGKVDENVSDATFCFNICFDGATMTNVFQGATFTLTGEVQAVQASHSNNWTWGEVFPAPTPPNPPVS